MTMRIWGATLALLLSATAALAQGQPMVATLCNSSGTWVPCVSGGAGSNAAAGAPGAAVPSSASYEGINVAGTLRGWTGISIGAHYAGTVAIVDGSGNQITSFGGGTQYTHDAALTIGTSIGTIPMGRASAAAPSDVSADGDATAPWYLRNGAIASQVTFGGVLATTGNGASGTGVQRVTIANDSTGTLAVTNAGTFATQVSSISAGDNNIGNVDIVTMPTVTVNAHAVTNAGTFVTQENGALLTAAQLLDNVVAVEDAVAGSGFSGIPMLAVRQDSQSDLAADGDFIPMTVDADGLLRVTVGGGSGGTAVADDADFTAGTTSFTPVGGFYQSTVTACTDGDACTAGITTGRAVKVHVSNADGSSATLATDATVGSAFPTAGPGSVGEYKEFDGSALPTTTNVGTEGEASPIATTLQGVQYVMVVSEDGALERGTATTPMVVGDGTGALNVICDSGCAGGTQYAEDAAHASGNTGTLGLAVRNDAGTALAADGDNIPLMVNSAGALYTTFAGSVTVTDGAGALNVIIDSSAALTVSDGAGAMNTIIDSGTVTTVSTVTSLSQLGGVAVPVEDSAETANGTGTYAMSVRRDTAASSAGTTGDNATINTDATGRLWVNPSHNGVEDVAETAGADLAMAGTVRRDTAATSAGTTGDNATLNTDGLGRLWIRPGGPCEDHARISSAAIDSAASGNVEIVALNGSDLIYICGYSVVAGAATGLQLIYGTGTACATGETDMTGVWSLAANGGITQANGGAPQFVVPAGNAFCIENSGANSVQGHVTYVRTAAP